MHEALHATRLIAAKPRCSGRGWVSRWRQRNVFGCFASVEYILLKNYETLQSMCDRLLCAEWNRTEKVIITIKSVAVNMRPATCLSADWCSAANRSVTLQQDREALACTALSNLTRYLQPKLSRGCYATVSYHKLCIIARSSTVHRTESSVSVMGHARSAAD